jgi:CIC family chloride channel protein
MDKEVLVLPTETTLDQLLRRSDLAGRLAHVVVATGKRIKGVQRINTSLRQSHIGTDAATTLGQIAHRDFTVARQDDIIFDVIDRMTRHKAAMAVIVRGPHRIPRASDVVGVITKEHIADSVAESVRSYPKGT